ncbi:TPA: nuclear receptor NHR-99 [Salmonella enterica subsp. salamae serovar 28:r:e,n,z15]|nr:nuclear receptor NHR-99 [Salmonella enterica subsp. salamae serovar 28:r:e,n,z15]
MNKNIASNIMASLMRLNDSTNDVIYEIEKIDDNENKKIFRRAIAGIVLMIDSELMQPIIKEYPDLDPDKDDLSQ